MASGSSFEVTISPFRKVEPVEQEEAAILVLAPFTKPPRLIFKNVTKGVVAKQAVVIRNPSNVSVQVELVKLPVPEKGLAVSATQLEVPPHGEETIEVTWRPTEVGNWRFTIGVKTSCTLKMDVIILCSSISKKPVQKKGLHRKWAQSLPSNPKSRPLKLQSPKIEKKKSPSFPVGTPVSKRRQTFVLSRSRVSPLMPSNAQEYAPPSSTREWSRSRAPATPTRQSRTPSQQSLVHSQLESRAARKPHTPNRRSLVHTQVEEETWQETWSCSRKVTCERRMEREEFSTPVRSPNPKFRIGGMCTIGRRTSNTERLQESVTPNIVPILDSFSFSPAVQPAPLRRVTFDVFPPSTEIHRGGKLDSIPEVTVVDVSADSLDEPKSHNISSETYAIDKSPCNLHDLHDISPLSRTGKLFATESLPPEKVNKPNFSFDSYKISPIAQRSDLPAKTTMASEESVGYEKSDFKFIPLQAKKSSRADVNQPLSHIELATSGPAVGSLLTDFNYETQTDFPWSPARNSPLDLTCNKLISHQKQSPLIRPSALKEFSPFENLDVNLGKFESICTENLPQNLKLNENNMTRDENFDPLNLWTAKFGIGNDTDAKSKLSHVVLANSLPETSHLQKSHNKLHSVPHKESVDYSFHSIKTLVSPRRKGLKDISHVTNLEESPHMSINLGFEPSPLMKTTSISPIAHLDFLPSKRMDSEKMASVDNIVNSSPKEENASCIEKSDLASPFNDLNFPLPKNIISDKFTSVKNNVHISPRDSLEFSPPKIPASNKSPIGNISGIDYLDFSLPNVISDETTFVRTAPEPEFFPPKNVITDNTGDLKIIHISPRDSLEISFPAHTSPRSSLDFSPTLSRVLALAGSFDIDDQGFLQHKNDLPDKSAPLVGSSCTSQRDIPDLPSPKNASLPQSISDGIASVMESSDVSSVDSLNVSPQVGGVPEKPSVLTFSPPRNISPDCVSSNNSSYFSSQMKESSALKGTLLTFSPPRTIIDGKTTGKVSSISSFDFTVPNKHVSNGQSSVVLTFSPPKGVIGVGQTSLNTLKPEHLSLKKNGHVTPMCSPPKKTAFDSTVKATSQTASKEPPTRAPGGSIHKRKRKSSTLPVTRLILLSAKKAKTQEKSVRLHDPDLFLSNITNPKSSISTSIVNPFLTCSIYYDQEWFDEREREFVKWLNYLLTPPEQLSSSDQLPQVDVAELWARSCKLEVAPAPSRETVSSLYLVNRRLDSLRKAACALFRSSDISSVLSKVLIHIDREILAIRHDRNLHLDIGLKQRVLKLLLCYNPLWLRVGLEAIYGRTIPLESNSDAVGLVSFIAHHLLSDPYIVQQHSLRGVLHTFKPGFDTAMKKFILRKFLFLVYFLDRAKQRKLIGHDPCLFCKDATYKESREILLAFSRDLLSGIGDVTKHLRTLGYVVEHRQTYLHEYNYAVTSLGADLRDGVRLVRVMEIILQKPNLSLKLRTPAISRLQKVHNVQVALEALKDAGFTLEGNISAKDIVEGHKEKTLSLLWQIIYKFQAPHFNAAAVRIQAWWRGNSLKVCIKHRIRERKVQEAQVLACVVIQKHWRGYVQRKHYQQARSALVRLQRRWRAHLQMKQVRAQFLAKRNAVVKLQAICRGFLLRRNLQTCREMASAYRIQTWYRRHLALRRIKVILSVYHSYRNEVKKKHHCALKIQSWYRRIIEARRINSVCVLYQKYCEETKIRKHSAVKIQAWYRRTVQGRRIDSICALYRNYCLETKERNCSAIKIQSWYRRMVQVRKINAICDLYRNYCLETQLRHNSATKIQMWYRRMVQARRINVICTLYRNYCEEAKIQLFSAVRIQSWYRRVVEAKRIGTICVLYRNYCEETKRRNRSAITIQSWYRRMLLIRKIDAIFILHQKYCAETKKRNHSAIRIQTWYRRIVEARRIYAICVLYKKYCEETKLRHLSATKIQVWYRRMIQAQRIENICALYKSYCIETMRRNRLAVKIQTWYRRMNQAKRIDAICVLYKNYCAEMKKQNYSAIRIQVWYRRMVKARRLAAIRSLYKNYCEEMKKRCLSAAMIQVWYRRMLQARRIESICSLYQDYCQQTKLWHYSALKIQAWYRRMCQARKIEYICLLYRGYCRDIKKRNHSAIKIQSWYRRMLKAKRIHTICVLYHNCCEEVRRENSSIKIQTWYRRMIEARKLITFCTLYKNYCEEMQKRRLSAAKIQVWYRRTIQAKRIENICALYKSYCEETRRRNQSAVRIQTWYLRMVQVKQLEAICCLYKNYCEEIRRQNRSAIRIQSWYRRLREARRLGKVCSLYRNYCEETKKLNRSAMRIQAWYWRSVQARRINAICVLYKEYCEETRRRNCAVIKIQTWYRRMVEARRLGKICSLYRDYCDEMKRRNCSAKRIQTWYRRLIEAKRLRKIGSLYRDYCNEIKRKNSCALKIQTSYRRLLVSRRLAAICFLYRDYCEERRRHCAALKIQAWYRRLREARRLAAISFLYRNYCGEKRRDRAVVMIQGWYRRMLTVRKLNVVLCLYEKHRAEVRAMRRVATHHYDALCVRATVVLQKHVRRYLQRRKYHAMLQKVVIIQQWWRGRLAVRGYRRSFLQKKAAIVMIQARWRGYHVRKELNSSNREDTRHMDHNHSLRKRYTLALGNWAPTISYGELLIFVQVLDTVTRLSRELSEEFSTHHLEKLFQTISQCNRSIPASQVLEFATSVLVNLVKHNGSMHNVWKADTVDVLLRLMSGWQGKPCTVFCNCCTVLWLLAQDPTKAAAILEIKNARSMLQKFHEVEKTKNKVVSRRTCAEVKTKFKLPDVIPEWTLVKRNRPRSFQDPRFAISTLIKKLGFGSKK